MPGGSSAARPEGRRPGRRPGAGGAREDILAAARSVFGELGFEGATVRLVAARADVDAALIYHYFGSKQRLFVAATEIPFDWAAALPALADRSPAETGEQLVRLMLGLWEDPAIRPRLMGLVRSATSDPEAAAMLRRLLAEGPVSALGRAIGGPDGELRAMLAASHIMGVALLRHILRVEPLASADIGTLADLLGPTVGTYLVVAADTEGEAQRGA